MTAPLLELQGVIVAALKAEGELAAIITDRVFDDVPRDPTTGAVTAKFPYVSMGAVDIVTIGADCLDDAEFSFQIDAWSRAVGFPEVRRIEDVVFRTLHQADFELTDHALVMLEHQRSAFVRASDGKTSHAAIQFTGFIERR